MDKELHRFVLSSSCLLDSPPGACLDIPPAAGDVSWRYDNLELSCFSSNRYRNRQPSNSSNNSQTKGAIVFRERKWPPSFVILLFICQVHLAG